MGVARPVCPNCGGKDFAWGCNVEPTPHAPRDSLFRLNEVRVIAYLYCEQCSETIAWLHEQEIIETLETESPSWYKRRWPDTFKGR